MCYTHICVTYFVKKEEEESTKAEAEEKTTDASGDAFVTTVKHIIEYCITSFYPAILDCTRQCTASRHCIRKESKKDG